jgi:hypothetical protein
MKLGLGEVIYVSVLSTIGIAALAALVVIMSRV